MLQEYTTVKELKKSLKPLSKKAKALVNIKKSLESLPRSKKAKRRRYEDLLGTWEQRAKAYTGKSFPLKPLQELVARDSYLPTAGIKCGRGEDGQVVKMGKAEVPMLYEPILSPESPVLLELTEEGLTMIVQEGGVEVVINLKHLSWPECNKDKDTKASKWLVPEGTLVLMN